MLSLIGNDCDNMTFGQLKLKIYQTNTFSYFFEMYMAAIRSLLEAKFISDTILIPNVNYSLAIVKANPCYNRHYIHFRRVGWLFWV